MSEPLPLADAIRACQAVAARYADPPAWWARLTPAEQTAVRTLAATRPLSLEEAAPFLTRYGWDWVQASAALGLRLERVDAQEVQTDGRS